MSTFFVIPSKRPPAEALVCLREWYKMGYHCIIQRDPGEEPDEFSFDLEQIVRVVERPYAGYAEAVNHLVHIALGEGAEWIVTAGDDMYPDPHKRADEIARECGQYFGIREMDDVNALPEAIRTQARGTFGVMQPTGDRWLVNGPGTKPGSECVAGSPWMGREFCRRMYGGRGPLCEEYFHCGEDRELQEVATMMGIFWQRQDLTHHHNHWGRPKEGERIAPNSRMPAFLRRANSREEWDKYEAVFNRRKASGFPGHEPIP